MVVTLKATISIELVMTKNNFTTTSIALLTVALAFVIATPAYAHDSNSNIMTYDPFDASDGNQKIWYDIYSLNYVDLDGSDNNGAGLRLIAEVARADLHYNTDFDVTETSNWSYGDSVFDAAYLGNGVWGATASWGSGTGQYKFIYLNTSNNVNYQQTAGCTNNLDKPNPLYVSNHEFGHFAGLDHHGTTSNSHTAMMDDCNPGQASLKTEDKNDITDWYN